MEEKRTYTTRQDTQTPSVLIAELYALHHTHRESTRLFLMETSQGVTETQITDTLWQGFPHLTDPSSLQDQNFVKQTQGIDIQTEENKKDNEQKKRLRTMSQTTQTQPLLFVTDTFVTALETIPAEDWCRTWETGRTIMLRRTSKRAKEVVDKMHLPAVVRLSGNFWTDVRNVTTSEKIQFVIRQVTLMTVWCLISTLALSYCFFDMKGQGAESLVGVLTQ